MNAQFADAVNQITVAIPLTNVAGKIRIKKRNGVQEYGVPVATRQVPFSEECYIEWQIGYDVVKKDAAKAERTMLRDKTFVGANGEEKYLYELSEYIAYFYRRGLISREEITTLAEQLSALTENDFLDGFSIVRSRMHSAVINGTDFLVGDIRYPLFIRALGESGMIAEIVNRERQHAVGTQPMLYLCIPMNKIDGWETVRGRTANPKEEAVLTISEETVSVFFELLKLFGYLSATHNHDVIEILKLIAEQG